MKKMLACLVLVLVSVSPASAQNYYANVQLTIDNTAAGIGFTASDLIIGSGHPQVNSASCVSNSASGEFRYRTDGTAPTTTVGVPVPASGALLFTNTSALLNFKGIRTGGTSAVLNCTLSDAVVPNGMPVGPVGAGGGGSSTLTCVGDTSTPCAVRGAVTNNVQAPPTNGNLPVLPMLANAAAPTITEGFITYGSVDLAGNLRAIGSLAANGVAAATNRIGTLPCIVETGTLPTLTDGRNAPCYVNTVGATIGTLVQPDGTAVTLANDPCGSTTKTSVPIDTATSGNVQLVALSGSTVVYICSVDVTAEATVDVQFIYGTGSACATGETDLTAPYAFSTTTGLLGINKGSGGYYVYKTAAGNAFCIELGGAVQVNGSVTYVQQ